jgi:hypothetical protein
MADEVHVHQTPPAGNGGGGGAGWLVAGLVIVVLVVVLWFVFGRAGGNEQVIPDQIEVDVNVDDARRPGG